MAGGAIQPRILRLRFAQMGLRKASAQDDSFRGARAIGDESDVLFGNSYRGR